MSDDESFLARWSRRKLGATATRGQPKPEDVGVAAASETSPSPTPSPARDIQSSAPVEPESLPPIESIGAASDIRAFLAAGVPADLTRAALRHAWAADPSIRDFVGLSENSWDFNAPGGVPGFGSVKAEDVHRLLARVMGEPEAGETAPPPVGKTLPADVAAEPDCRQAAAHDAAQDRLARDHDVAADHHDRPPHNEVKIAMRHEPGEREQHAPLPRRGHGGALPG